MAKKTNYIAKAPDDQGLINYSAEEHAIWRDLYAQQIPNTKKYAADAYVKGLDLLNMPTNRIPQCLELSEHLIPLTGWHVAPVPANWLWPLLYYAGRKDFSRGLVYSL